MTNRHTLAALSALALTAAAGLAQSTAFTYQGQLKNNGLPANGLFDVRFSLFNAVTGGTQVGTTQCVNNVTVTDGLFTTTLDFGQQFATPAALFLQIESRVDTGQPCTTTTGFTTLTPRQALTPTPMANHAKSAFALDAADGSPTNAVVVDNNGNMGVNIAAPQAKLHVFGDHVQFRLQDDDNATSYALFDDQSAGQMRINKVADATVSFIDLNPQVVNGVSNTHIRFFRETNTTGTRSVIFNAGNNTNQQSAQIGVGGTSSYFQADGGNVGIGTQTPSNKLHIAKTGGVGTAGGPGLILQDTGPNSAQSGYLAFWNSNPTETGWFGYGTPGSPHMTMINARAGGDIFITPAPGRAVKVPVLEITGADLAEKFPASEKLEPGMVVAIDKAHRGELCLSRGAYNRCVAGVVSGANNFSVGAVLGNLPGHADAPAVALSGRVYVYCDASSGAIEPGDLLTTSDVPGHAMKAGDDARANGAVIGKAMEGLEKDGRGLVLVLVNLQ